MEGKRFEILLNPWVIILGMVTGGILGVYFKSFVFYIKPIGEIYLSLLQMSVIPIMVSAIVVSIGKLMKLKDANTYLKKICVVFILFLFVIVLITLDSIMDPVLTLLNVCLSSAVASIIASDNSIKTGGEKCGA